MKDKKIIAEVAAKANINEAQAKIALDTIRALQDTYSPQVSESYIPYFKIPSMSSRLDILKQAMKQELSSGVFKELVALTKLPVKFLAEQVFEVTPKTFSKYRDEKLHMPSRVSELAFKLKQLYIAGIDVFGSAKAFNEWLHLDSFGLGGHKPSEMLKTSTGIDLVFEEVKRIEFGATA